MPELLRVRSLGHGSHGCVFELLPRTARRTVHLPAPCAVVLVAVTVEAPQCMDTRADSSHRKRRDFSVEWSPDGTTLVSGSRDATIKRWNASTGECESTLRGHTADNEVCTCQHHAEDGDPPFEQDPECPVNGHSCQVTGVCFSRDGSYLVSCSRDKTVRLWNTHTVESTGSRSQIVDPEGPHRSHS